MLKRAFTLIELLVVIAIIAILAAILFPVFAQAKMAAKKASDLSNMKQQGTSMYLYLQDSDDVFFPYRWSDAGGAPVNPFSNDPRMDPGTKSTIFWAMMLQPYCKNQDMFKSPTLDQKAWYGVDPQGPAAGHDSWGGQNSYGLNRMVFLPGLNGFNSTALAETANTLIITDTTYYDLMPKMTKHDATDAFALGQFIGDPTNKQFGVTEKGNCGYFYYWVQLGNGTCTSSNPTTVDQETAAFNKVATRNGGTLNGVFGDTHAKSYPTTRVVYDLVDNNDKSFWDPWKQGVK